MSPGLRDLGAMVLLAGLTCYAFLPRRFLYIWDDTFFWPERHFFTNNLDWLWHLLPFNQTRYTWVGYDLLVRPGLFF